MLANKRTDKSFAAFYFCFLFGFRTAIVLFSHRWKQWTEQLIWCVRLIWICFTSSFGNSVFRRNSCCCFFSLLWIKSRLNGSLYNIGSELKMHSKKRDSTIHINNNTRFSFCWNGCHFFVVFVSAFIRSFDVCEWENHRFNNSFAFVQFLWFFRQDHCLPFGAVKN